VLTIWGAPSFAARDVILIWHRQQVGLEAFERPRADAADAEQVVVVAKGAGVGARFDDAAGERFADVGQFGELGPGGLVDVDQVSRGKRFGAVDFDQFTAMAAVGEPVNRHADECAGDEAGDGGLIGAAKEPGRRVGVVHLSIGCPLVGHCLFAVLACRPTGHYCVIAGRFPARNRSESRLLCERRFISRLAVSYAERSEMDTLAR
jgi:hypothetical protein